MSIIVRALITAALMLCLSQLGYADSSVTQRIPQLANDKVKIWETIIYPHSHQALKMHRHDYDRVLIALTDGKLKITNAKNKTHYLMLTKNKVYYLKKDVPGELHKDENVGKQPIKVMVVQLNK